MTANAYIGGDALIGGKLKTTSINNNGGNDITINQTNGTETARYTNDGKLGIGTTNPSKTLDVDGDINYTGTLYQNGSAVALAGGASSFDNVTIVGDSNPKLLIKPESTTGKDSSMELRGARNSGNSSWANTSIKFTNYNDNLSSNSNGGIHTLGEIWGQVTDATNNIGSLVFSTSSNGTSSGLTPRLTISSSGGVGINNSTPSQNYNLDVDGHINFTGTLYQNGSAVSLGGGGASSLDDLSDVKFEGTHFEQSLKIGDTNTGTLSYARYNVGIGKHSLNSITSGDHNTAVGYYSLFSHTSGQDNTALGAYALNDNTSGNYNTAIGVRALDNNTTANYNTAIGAYALQGATSGMTSETCIAIGPYALKDSTTGSKNIAIGYYAGANTTSAAYNVFIGHESGRLGEDTNASNGSVGIGYQSLYYKGGHNNTALGNNAMKGNANRGITCRWNVAVGTNTLEDILGEGNVAMGHNSLKIASTVSHNTAVGYYAGSGLTTGDGGNTCIGTHSGNYNSTSSNCTFLGMNAAASYGNTTTYDRSTAVGFESIITTNNQLVLGKSNTTVYVPNNLTVDGTFTNSSDQRIKTNITDVNDATALEKIRLIKPKTYNYINTRNRTSDTVYGFIAQEVKEVIPYAVTEKTKEIPNIYQNAKITKNTIEFTNFNTDLLEKDASNNLFKIITFHKGDSHIHATIVNVIDSNKILIDYISDEDEEENAVYNEEEIFVVGQIVDNFHCISKDHIWTISTAALQEVDRQLQEEKAKRIEMEAKLESIMTILQNNNLT
jgi:hypothetical protein